MSSATIAGKSICAGAAAGFSWLIGAFDVSIQTLLFLVVLDFILGTTFAFKDKTVSSKKAWDGLVKKILTFAIVAVAYQIDKLTGTDGAIRLIAIYGFIGSELFSIIENSGKLGLQIPAKLLQYFNDFIDKSKEGGNDAE